VIDGKALRTRIYGKLNWMRMDLEVIDKTGVMQRMRSARDHKLRDIE